jgi:hypothetical protein
VQLMACITWASPFGVSQSVTLLLVAISAFYVLIWWLIARR